MRRSRVHVLRKYAVALLAVPVLILVYAGSFLRHSALARTGVAVGLGAILGLGAIALARPAPTIATAPTTIVPEPQAVFRTAVATGVAADAPATITFTTAMDRTSVAASLSVRPATPIKLTWNTAGTVVTVEPAGHWTPDTFHTITVEPGALAASGRPLTTPARAEFLTRGPAAATLAATDRSGKRVALTTAFTIAFDAEIDPASLDGAVTLEPAATGTIRVDATVDGAPTYRFIPATPLAPSTRYKVTLDGVLDASGVELAPVTLAVRTVAAPAVVRFRPLPKTQDVPRDAAISVRFTRSMDRASTKAAFSVTVDGKKVAGKVSFAEDDTVLVFQPKAKLPYDKRIVAAVAAAAKAADGVPLAEAGKVAFRTVEKAKRASSSGGGSGSSGGRAVASGKWGAVEIYYLRLMNCTRTGGWVTSTGRCSSPGGRNVAPLKLSTGISTKVARPYAKLLATRGACSHFIGGNPGDRLRRAGYTNYTWAENIGCRSGNPRSAVLGSHRFFQSEKSYNGGHYVNLMNRKYDRVGIGVWVSSGRVRLVVDFYHP
jgi:uncharacterized protein YkwD